jgi:hypothetical protein
VSSFKTAAAMRGPLIALACGLAAAVVVLRALYGGGEPQPATRPAPVAPVPASANVQAVTPLPQPLPQPLLPPPPPQPPPPVPPAQRPGALAAASTIAAAATKPESPQASPAVASAFALSSDHRALIQGTFLAAADHDQLEREPRDDAWATETERLIRQELARHRSAVDFDVIAVDCRQTLCAIQAFSNGVNGHRQWVEAVDELYKETLASAFDSVNTAFPTQGSSRSPVLTFLHRKPVVPKG